MNYTMELYRNAAQPTITVCQLIEGEYQMQRFVAGQRLESSLFPDLELTTDAIFQPGGL